MLSSPGGLLLSHVEQPRGLVARCLVDMLSGPGGLSLVMLSSPGGLLLVMLSSPGGLLLVMLSSPGGLLLVMSVGVLGKLYENRSCWLMSAVVCDLVACSELSCLGDARLRPRGRLCQAEVRPRLRQYRRNQI
jgi:hypothetical protein